jgi:hypothetical protein
LKANDIGGVVTSSKGPEAGVWVIAELANSASKFAKIVVTDDQGRYLVPELPAGSYRVWVRGYGLVDSKPVDGTPGKSLALAAVLAPNPRAAAEYYPAAYWASLIKIPTKSDFPMPIQPAPPIAGAPDPIKDTHANNRAKDPPPPSVFMNQDEWLAKFKGCWTCHQMGEKSTREIPPNIGTYPSSALAWERLVSSGQVGRGMLGEVNAMGHDRTRAMYAAARESRAQRGDYEVELGGADRIPARDDQHRSEEAHGECVRAGVWHGLVRGLRQG